MNPSRRAQPVARKALLAWLLIVPIAILNGIFRETALLHLLGPSAALSVSGILLSLFILAWAWLILPYFGPPDARRYRHIGLGWLILTIVFEFGFGLIAAGKTWEELFQAYDMRNGNLWPAVLAVIAVAPSIAAKIRARA